MDNFGGKTTFMTYIMSLINKNTIHIMYDACMYVIRYIL